MAENIAWDIKNKIEMLEGIPDEKCREYKMRIQQLEDDIKQAEIEFGLRRQYIKACYRR